MRGKPLAVILEPSETERKTLEYALTERLTDHFSVLESDSLAHALPAVQKWAEKNPAGVLGVVWFGTIPEPEPLEEWLSQLGTVAQDTLVVVAKEEHVFFDHDGFDAQLPLLALLNKPYRLAEVVTALRQVRRYVLKGAVDDKEVERQSRQVRMLNKAAREISNEISFVKVVDRFLQIVIDTTNSSRALLLMERDGQMILEAIAEVGEDVARRLEMTPETAVELTQQVLENLETLQSLKLSEPFQLSTPIRRMGKVIGHVFIERSPLLKPYEPSQKEMLQTLAAQAAISFDKANFYDSLQEKTRELAEEKEKVELAAQQLQLQNRDIMESMRYAKRIQRSIIPGREVVQQYLPDSFVFYKPKDIVSGDFFWWSESKDSFHIAACDCTGHGIPGALMSVICSSALNHAVQMKNLTTPTDILNSVHQEVRAQLRQDQDPTASPDGMDVALLRFILGQPLIQFAGARRPLWLLRNGTLYEYDGYKQSIGGQIDEENMFKGFTLRLEPNDQLYIFSDGVIDQFGAETGRKFMTRRLREFVLRYTDLPMPEVGIHFRALINNWKGDEVQTDDMTLIGIRYRPD
jgi:serine phosphatase RsbU (regulator of sigma subunit)